MARAVRLIARYPFVAGTVVALVVVGVLLATGLGEAAHWVASLYVGAFIIWTAVGMVRAMLRREFGLDILAVVAMAATLLTGEYLAALIVALMLSGGEALEDFAERRARRELTALLERAPQTAHVLDDGADGADAGEAIHEVPVAEVRVGDHLLVRPAELVPVDGELLDAGEFDESSLSGESLPVSREPGEEVPSGAVNGAAAVRIRALRSSADSQYQRIIELVAAAERSKAPVVRLADRFAVPFTLAALVLGGIAWAVSGEPVRFAEVLVLATPCPLLIAAPVAFLGGLSQASKRGVIVKGGAVLERLARVRAAAFDKTGTLTAGRPELVELRPAPGREAYELLRLAASAEQYSTHVLAQGITGAAIARGLRLVPAVEASEIATHGVTARIEGHEVAVGKPAYIADITGARPTSDLAPGQAAAYVAVDGEYAGALVLADDPRPESAEVVAWLRAHGVERVAMLTGDAAATARSIAAPLGIQEVHAELLPADKVELLAAMTPRPVLMVGDGVNDAPVLAAADIGMAMGARGATAAGEAADAVILADSLARIIDAVRIGRHTVAVALTAIWIGVGLSLALMLVAMTGAIPAVAGALTQELVDLATILYALRALRPPRAAPTASRQPSSVSPT